MNMKTVILLPLAIATLLCGCYTEFISTTPSAMPQPTSDSSKDTIVIREQVSVIPTPERQNCYWTRDFFGRPYLKCVSNFYSHNWQIYNNYPWWYRENPFYYDEQGRCPQYYFYDPACGCCKHYLSNGGGGSSGGGGSTGGSTSNIPRRSITTSPSAPSTPLNKPSSTSGGTSSLPETQDPDRKIIRRSIDSPSPAPVEKPLEKETNQGETIPVPPTQPEVQKEQPPIPTDSTLVPKVIRRRSL